nr:ulp1 protease family, C-terminal catalytic domain-containing protein [Tanacetum cinerariifolium]
MDRSKEATNANGNTEGDMLSFTQMHGIRIASGAIDVFTHVLNYAEKFRDRKSLRRVFCNTSMVSEKMLCEDWDA